MNYFIFSNKNLMSFKFTISVKTFIILVVVLSVNVISYAQQPIALVGATLIDGTGKAPVKNSVVLIEGAKITAVGIQDHF